MGDHIPFGVASDRTDAAGKTNECERACVLSFHEVAVGLPLGVSRPVAKIGDRRRLRELNEVAESPPLVRSW